MSEKKVEYLELVYDLIFVYIIGRNNSLLLHVDGGFVNGSVYLAYILSSLAVIQIWNFSTYYTNIFGRNRVRDHVFMFVNMYLLYYIGEGTRLHWERFQNQYHVAWALILINIGIQFLLERREQKSPEELRTINGMCKVLFGEAALILAAIPIFNATGVQLAGVAVLCGIAGTWFIAGKVRQTNVDFMHLSERAMLFVVFTFGEMIIALASYFEGELDFSSIYFSAMCFLIVVGLFLCYEMLYDHIVDREKETTGLGYMMIHIFLVFGMNNLTTALEFMQDEKIRLMPKTLMLIGSFLLVFGCMFALMAFAKEERRCCRRSLAPVLVLTILFVISMLLMRERMYVNILITVVYVFFVFFTIRKTAKS
ncbi:MAG: low temperature requirement protein A [Blautia sp.]|nr:low temperature requirement protein A [Blautia sp.]